MELSSEATTDTSSSTSGGPTSCSPPGTSSTSGDTSTSSSDTTSYPGSTSSASSTDTDTDGLGLPDEPIVFITSTAYAGDLGGLGGADQLCLAEALAAGIDRPFRAWVSGTDHDDPESTFAPTAPYVRRDGAPVADDFADLVDGPLDNPIDLTATGETPPVETYGTEVWTGTNADGTHAGTGCNNFNNSDGVSQGGIGSLTATGSTWSNDGGEGCDQLNFVYCVQQGE